MIELIDVHKKFNKLKVLNGISIKIEKGETFVIIGQSSGLTPFKVIALVGQTAWQADLQGRPDLSLARVRAMEQSLSWRITRPLRALKRWLTGAR